MASLRRQREALSRFAWREARARGEANEGRLLESARRVGREFAGFVRARRATRREDQRGVDVAIEFSWGDVMLQAKSSVASARLFVTLPWGLRARAIAVSLDDAVTDGRVRRAIARRMEAAGR